MIILDSSGWIEFFGDKPNATTFENILTKHNAADVGIPTIVTYEICKFCEREYDSGRRIEIVATLRGFRSLPMDDNTAMLAAKLGHAHKLPMADSIIYATALLHEATLYTQDEHFKGLPGVKYIKP